MKRNREKMSTQAASTEYVELRCRADKSLMARIKEVPSGEIEIKCRRCKKKFKFNFPMNQKLVEASGDQKRGEEGLDHT